MHRVIQGRGEHEHGGQVRGGGGGGGEYGTVAKGREHRRSIQEKQEAHGRSSRGRDSATVAYTTAEETYGESHVRDAHTGPYVACTAHESLCETVGSVAPQRHPGDLIFLRFGDEGG